MTREIKQNERRKILKKERWLGIFVPVRHDSIDRVWIFYEGGNKRENNATERSMRDDEEKKLKLSCRLLFALDCNAHAGGFSPHCLLCIG